MSFILSQRSYNNLEGVHHHLLEVIDLAIQITPVDFAVIEGVRTKEKQQEYYNAGKSKTLNSRHLTGHAVDLAAYVDGKIVWHPWELYEDIAQAMFRAAYMRDVPIRWGGFFATFNNGQLRAFRDGVHFELDRRLYHAPETT